MVLRWTNARATVQSDHRFQVPADIAVCPYCEARLTAQAQGWTETEPGSGVWAVDLLDMDCDSEPDIDSQAWDDWFEHHGYAP